MIPQGGFDHRGYGHRLVFAKISQYHSYDDDDEQAAARDVMMYVTC